MPADHRSPAPVALTFDDGPDPVWTPLVLDALAQARATFFVVEPRSARYRGVRPASRSTHGRLAGSKGHRGRIELADDGSLPESVWRRHAEHVRLRHECLLSEPGPAGQTQHWQFSGASLALKAEVYREIGGLEPLTALEDEHLESVLRHHDISIDRLLSVRVTTSPRLEGRAKRGLSYDLARRALSLGEQEADR